MARRTIYPLFLIILIVGLIALSYLYFGPIIVVNIPPLPTSIYNGSLDQQLIDNLRTAQSNGEINRDQAIGLAELYCLQMNGSTSAVDPYHIQAVHVTEAQATHRLMAGKYSTSSAPVWFVSMDGSWEHIDGPVPQGTNTPPLVFSHCTVIIDAKTGEFGGGTN